MSLRKRILLIIALITAALFCLMAFLTWSVIVNRSVSLEDKAILQNLNRAHKALEVEMLRLQTSVAEYANWDDTYKFMQEYNQEYLDSSFSPSTFITNQLNAVFIFDAQGNIIYEQGYDYINQKEIAVSEQIRSHLDSRGLLLTNSGLGLPAWGFIKLPEGDMFIAASPILTSERQGPSMGTVVMGRYLNEPIVKGLQETTGLKLSFLEYDQTNTDKEVGDVLKGLTSGKDETIRKIDENNLGGYGLVKDIYQQPILLLKVEQPRDIYQHSKYTTLYILFLILIMGLIYGWVILS